MKIIAITGSMGSGKSSALRYLAKQGYPTLSADTVVHELYRNDEQLQHKVVALLGPEIKDEQGINREALGQIFFENPKVKIEIETIVHERVYEVITEWVQQQGDNLGFVEIPLLFESEAQDNYYSTLLIAIDEELQITRLMVSRGLTRQQIQTRLAYQMPQAQKIALADTVIYNNSDLMSLFQQLDQYVKEVKSGLIKDESISTTR